MNAKIQVFRKIVFFPMMFILVALACSIPGGATSAVGLESTLTMAALSTVVAGTQTALAGGAQSETVATETVVPSEGELEETSIIPTNTLIVVDHTIIPGQPGWATRWFLDTNSKSTANQNCAPGGDEYQKNQYERPFTQADMLYRPDVDIQRTEISYDSTFFYVKILLNGLNPETNTLQAAYGVELDTDKDGRGDYLIWASGPHKTKWAIEGVAAYKDTNNDVGANRPVYSDAPSSGNSYDMILFSNDMLQDPDAAWGRIAPNNPTEIQLAFKRSLVGSPQTFLWGVWADDGENDPKKLDYNDTFTSSEAGSPYPGANYPLKSLHTVDNTCREAFGFTPTGEEPGICHQLEVPPTATVTQTVTVTVTLTATE